MGTGASARQCESCFSTSAATLIEGGNKFLSLELELLFPHCEARLASWLGPRGLSGYVGSRHRSAQPHAQGIVGLSRGIARMQRKVGNQRRDKSVVLKVGAGHMQRIRRNADSNKRRERFRRAPRRLGSVRRGFRAPLDEGAAGFRTPMVSTK